MRLPPPLRPGDRVAVFAASSPFTPALAWRGLGWLAQRYRVVFDRAMFARKGYLAGDDARRRAEIERYLGDPTIRAMIAVRGGYGLSRIAHQIDWSPLRDQPRWVVGFSDVTAMHVEAMRVGVGSIHGPMVAALGRGDARARGETLACLEAPEAPLRLGGLRPVARGEAEGPLVGGNLTMLHACAAAGRMELPDGCLLLLEDVTERPYRIDRMLSTLLAGGHLRRVAGVVLGDFSDCHPGADGVSTDEVLRERLGELGVPVVAGAPIGHEIRNAPVVLGRRFVLDAGRGELVAR